MKNLNQVLSLPELARIGALKKDGVLGIDVPIAKTPEDFGLSGTLFVVVDSSNRSAVAVDRALPSDGYVFTPHDLQVAVVRQAQALGYLLGPDEAHSVDRQEQFGGEDGGIAAIVQAATQWLNFVYRFPRYRWGIRKLPVLGTVFGIYPMPEINRMVLHPSN